MNTKSNPKIERSSSRRNCNDSKIQCDIDMLKAEIDNLQKQINALAQKYQDDYTVEYDNYQKEELANLQKQLNAFEQKYLNDYTFEYDNYQKEKNDSLLLIYAISSALLLLIAAISVRINFYSLSLLATAFTIISIYKVFECALRSFHYFCRRKIHVRKITKEK